MKTLKCTHCNTILGEIDGPNIGFTPDKETAKRFYCMGGIVLIGCLKCGTVQIMVVGNINEI